MYVTFININIYKISINISRYFHSDVYLYGTQLHVDYFI